MLRRTALRRYLTALLSSDEVVQGPNCETGPLYLNCDGRSPDVFDHETRQLFENIEASFSLEAKDVAILFYFSDVSYSGSANRLASTTISVVIDLVVNLTGGEARQEALDLIESRILYRIASQQTFIDAETNEHLVSFVRWNPSAPFNVRTSDDSAFTGRYAIRSMRFLVATNDCIETVNCGLEPLCFNFDDAVRRPSGC